MLEFNVLQWAILISSGYKYFLFVENNKSLLNDPLTLEIRVIPFQKLQQAKSVKSLYDESVYLLKAIYDYELIYDLAQGIDGVKYYLNNTIELPQLEIKKALKLVN